MLLVRRFFFFQLLFILSHTAYSQTATLTGTVLDALHKPLYGVSVAVLGKTIATTTDEKGNYSLTVPSGQNLKIIFSFTGLHADSVNVNLAAGEKKVLNKILRERTVDIHEVNIEEQSLKSSNITRINPKTVLVIPTVNQSVEDLLKTLPGVSSANELSSTYSVRGGNYDENLVYVNDIEVYRPFLVRSGQQEGLSFINPDMVSSISFSAGGFDAIYGDKMSSVLDIKYRKPKVFGGAVSASLLGESLQLEGVSKNNKFSFIGGVRQKSNQYLLNTFQTTGEYKPSFTDVQFLGTFDANKKLEFEVFGNYARNRYNLIPQNRETDFGTINDAKRFTVFFEGQELDRYDAFTGAASATYHPKEKLKLKLIASAFTTSEEENYDILGQYYLDQLETDFAKANFGDVAFNLGVGSFLNHARNKLNADVFSVEHKGEFVGEKTLFQWGLKVQHEQIDDKLNEWYYNDSSGFSIPSTRDTIDPQILLNDVINSKVSLSSNRYSGYIQNTWQITDTSKFILTTGVRANYWDLNRQLVISPRVSVTYKPNKKKNLSFRAAAGYYYQPPFYRELRKLDGTVNKNVEAQQSIHFVFGNEYTFLALGREFKLTSEIFYKVLDNLVPYKVDNLRLRYFGENSSKGFARGIDFRLFGEFVPGLESWASISFLETQEDLNNDFYYVRMNQFGDTIIPGYTADQIATDSIRVEPGYIPRPADQRVNFGLFFQDYLPKFPTYKMQLSLLFGTGLPFGQPGKDRYKDVLRTPSYKRVDIGFSKQVIGEGVKHPPQSKFLRKFESIWISLEVFNLLQVSNVSSYIWITDISNARQYAVPNYLTGRQLNLRINMKF